MGMMDDMKHKMHDMNKEQIQSKVNQLTDKEKRGELTDKGREKLDKLRKKL